MEKIARYITMNVSHSVEILSAIIIGIALMKVLIRYICLLFLPEKKYSKESIRIQFGSSVAISLELLLGADVLSTAVSPSWGDIGKLASIAILRTSLNYFLGKELRQIKTETES